MPRRRVDYRNCPSSLTAPASRRAGWQSAGSIDRNRAQQFGKLTRGPRIEAAIGTLGRAGDLAKDLLDHSIVALLEHEGRHAQASELTGLGNDFVRVPLRARRR
jgi:hypothetical protein